MIADGLAELTTPIDAVRPDPDNARIHSQTQIEAYAASLVKYGQRKPIVADQSGLVLKGNGLLLAAQRLGWKEVAVSRVPFSAAEGRAYALADNHASDTSAFDAAIMNGILDALDDPTAIPGVDPVFIEAMSAASGTGSQDDLPLPPAAQPTTAERAFEAVIECPALAFAGAFRQRVQQLEAVFPSAEVNIERLSDE